MSKPHLLLAKDYWQSHLKPSDFAIDATCGNGHDTLFLSQRLPQGTVFALDIQENAIQKTKERLSGAANVHYFCQSHAHLKALPLPSPPQLIVYNLGYLPGGDKSITTMTEKTLESIGEALSILDENGALSITCYPGHEEGMREEEEFLSFLMTLACKMTYHQWDKPKAPSLLWIQTK